MTMGGETQVRPRASVRQTSGAVRAVLCVRCCACRLQQAVVTKQRRRRGPAAAEELKDFCGGLGAAEAHDLVTVKGLCAHESLDGLLWSSAACARVRVSIHVS